jgi:diguanylate cyclase (GGDEF)-like protein
VAWAVRPGVQPWALSTHIWTTDDGLPQNSVQAMIQDSRGYLWLATQEGLARFDGVRFRVFDTRSPPELPANNVTALVEDDDGTLWVGMRGGGLVRVIDRPGSITIDPIRELAGRNVRTLLLGRDHRLWIGTRGEGLWRMDGPDRVPAPVAAIPAQMILALAEERDGALWVATEGDGLYRLEDDQVTLHLDSESGLPVDTIWAVLTDTAGRLWIGTYGGGLVVRERGVLRVVNHAAGLPSDRVTALLQDHDGTVWIGTRGGGIARAAHGTVEAVPATEGTPDEAVTALLEDREGNLWVGSSGGGLIRVAESPFEVIRGSHSGDGLVARAVLETRSGQIWVGTSDAGLLRIDGGTLNRDGIPEGAPVRDVFALHEDPQGTLWVGTYQAGLYRLEGGRWTHWTTDDGLPSDTVWSFADAPNGDLWIGTLGGGVVRFDHRTFSPAAVSGSLSSNLVRCLALDDDGRLWIGTSRGLCFLDDDRFGCLDADPRLAAATVYDIHQDPDGLIWVATNGRGLWMIEDGEPTRLDTDIGLYDSLAYRILEDDAGFLWMSCNRGIYRAHRRDLVAVVHGEARTVECRVFGRADGMPTSECNGGSQPSGWLTTDGRLWFATAAGFVALDPQRLRPNAHPPPVRIEEVRVDGVETALGQTVEVPPGTRTLEIQYTAIALGSPRGVRFQSRLAPLDKGWIDAGGRRSVFYTHLPPGHYEFKVAACNNEGVWNPDVASLAITVEPRFWQRRSFYVGGSLLLLGLGFSIASARTASIRRRERRLESEVTNRTRDLLDVTRRLEEANHRLEELSLSDALTGIANRRRFDKDLAFVWAQAQRRQTPVGMIMVDVDLFKAYNDRYGHLAGDRCLERIAHTLSDLVRRETDLIARYGGEEFAVILDGADDAAVERMAEAMRRAVEALGIPHDTSNVAGVVTVSAGASTAVPAHEDSSSELTASADRALYDAKRLGRNRTVSSSGGSLSPPVVH